MPSSGSPSASTFILQGWRALPRSVRRLYIPFREKRSVGSAMGGWDRRRRRGWPLDGFGVVLLWFVHVRTAPLCSVGELLGRVRGVGSVVWRNHRARP